MPSIIGAILGQVLFFGWKWICGKAGSIVIMFCWMIPVFFFTFSSKAPAFPVGWFKGFGCTAGTGFAISTLIVPFFLAKAIILETTYHRGKALLGGFMASLMTSSFFFLWAMKTILFTPISK